MARLALPLVAAALAAVAASSDDGLLSVAVPLGDGQTATLSWAGDGSAAERAHVARAFAVAHDLQSGEGCVGDHACVGALLEALMRFEEGSSSSASSGAAKVDVLEHAYWAPEAAAAVARQEAALVAGPRAAPAAPPRTAPVPCVPPYCAFACHFDDAAAERALASGAARPDDDAAARAAYAELRALMERHPPPRTCGNGTARVHPISIGIPSHSVVGCVPRKSHDVKDYVQSPENKTYLFSHLEELAYQRAYRDARYGFTKAKSGWDCMRHYEILAAGAVPLFEGLERAPTGTMAHLPKKLLLHARGLADAPALDERAWARAAAALLAYTRARLTTAAMARYVLETAGHGDATRVAFLSGHEGEDYVRDMLLHGLREVLGSGVVDFVRPPHMYAVPAGAPSGNEDLYGNGFSYAHRMDADVFVDRSRLEARLAAKEFDVVVYGSVHRGMPYLDTVLATYAPSAVVFVDGEDAHGACRKALELAAKGTLFMREIADAC